MVGVCVGGCVGVCEFVCVCECARARGAQLGRAASPRFPAAVAPCPRKGCLTLLQTSACLFRMAPSQSPSKMLTSPDALFHNAALLGGERLQAASALAVSIPGLCNSRA